MPTPPTFVQRTFSRRFILLSSAGILLSAFAAGVLLNASVPPPSWVAGAAGDPAAAAGGEGAARASSLPEAVVSGLAAGLHPGAWAQLLGLAIWMVLLFRILSTARFPVMRVVAAIGGFACAWMGALALGWAWPSGLAEGEGAGSVSDLLRSGFLPMGAVLLGGLPWVSLLPRADGGTGPLALGAACGAGAMFPLAMSVGTFAGFGCPLAFVVAVLAGAAGGLLFDGLVRGLDHRRDWGPFGMAAPCLLLLAMAPELSARLVPESQRNLPGFLMMVACAVVMHFFYRRCMDEAPGVPGAPSESWTYLVAVALAFAPAILVMAWQGTWELGVVGLQVLVAAAGGVFVFLRTRGERLVD